MLDLNLSIITGTYGTGKTYYVVRQAYEAYKRGAVVISNMWLAFPHVRWYLPEDLPKILHEIYDYHENVIVPHEAPDSFLAAHDIKRDRDNPPREFFILADEGGVFFNSRNFQTNFKEKSLLVMLAEPRHFNMQICAITQKLDLIDKTFRDLAQEIIEFTPFIFGIFRRALSYDINRINDENLASEELKIIDTKTYFHWWHRRRDTSNFFGGLYFTKEVLGDLAIRRNEDICTLRDFFAREGTELDWRESLAKRAISRLGELDITPRQLKKYLKKEEKFLVDDKIIELEKESKDWQDEPITMDYEDYLEKMTIDEENLQNNPQGFKKIQP